jgi:hypothetical protein
MANSDLQDLHDQIDDTVIVMQQNIKKVAQRGERLDSLQGTTDDLSYLQSTFDVGQIEYES